ncbi:alpha-1-acid glycoprotein 1-like [Dermochelys coriacea]|uniref:alpha-1-acid glycoprotein 1-like n=1 Tax=Dermochelys coriacea TaxID=27794 RepID=UPI0018E6E622|nr:alpha-1-acid glycoprotein 1-like [Dermochelys coriacea]
MALACIVTFLSLAYILSAMHLHCELLLPQIPDNTTASKLLGKWFYIAGASQFPFHLLEMVLINNGYLDVNPTEQEQELLINQHVTVGDKCFSSNSTYLEVSINNATLIKYAKNQRTMGKLMNSSSKEIFLIQYQMHKEKNYTGLYLYARNQNMSKTQLEEFRDHAKCLGLREEEIIYAPWQKKELCQMKETRQTIPQTRRPQMQS